MRQRGRECRYAAERRVPRDPRRSLVAFRRQSPMGGRMSKSRAVSLGFVAALAAAAILGGVMSGGASAISRASTITPAPAFTAAQLTARPGADWLTAGGDLTSQRFSSLNQITAANVWGLKQVWKTNLDGSGKAAKYSQEATPIVSQRGHLHPYGQQRHLRPRRHDGRAPLEVRVEDHPEQQHGLLRLGRPRARLR